MFLRSRRANRSGGIGVTSRRTGARPQREVINDFAGLRYVEKHAAKKAIRHADILALHRLLAASVMDQGEAGKYRTIAVRVGPYRPPPAQAVSVATRESPALASLTFAPKAETMVVDDDLRAVQAGSGAVGRLATTGRVPGRPTDSTSWRSPGLSRTALRPARAS